MARDIDPHIWGESGWTMFTAPALTFPNDPTDEDKERLTNFYKNFGFGLPCTRCRRNYALGIEHSPPDVSCRRALTVWALNVHNRVNESLGRPAWDTRRALQHWTNKFGCSFMIQGYEDVVPQSNALLLSLAALVAASAIGQTSKQ